MSGPIRIGNAHGFWGDRLDAAAEMLSREPDLDFLTLDFLAEVSMSILALERFRDPQAGWPRDFLEIIRALAPYWREGGRCRVITNAGGLDPAACAEACLQVLGEAGCAGITIGVVSGDDVLGMIRAGQVDEQLLRNLDTGEAIAVIHDRLMTANAYLGAPAIAAALDRGADLVITGRIADPSLTVGACVHAYGWAWDDWDRLAGATIAGHLIECGTQVTGGISTDWLDVPHAEAIGFPIADVAQDSNCVITKPRGSGGLVSEQTVKEQLLYEIGDPGAYLSPDVTVSFLSLQVEDQGNDCVRVSGARGRPPPSSYKVSATYQAGSRAQGQLTVYGPAAAAKARRAAETVLDRLKQQGIALREAIVECLGEGACRPPGCVPAGPLELRETVVRLAVADASRAAVERFTHEWMPLITAGPQGSTGYSEGRPRIHPLFRFWPCLIDRECVEAAVTLLHAPGAAHREVSGRRDLLRPSPRFDAAACGPTQPAPSAVAVTKSPRLLGDIAYARSGDKGIHANVGLIARRADHFARLCCEATPERVAEHLGLAGPGRVSRYLLPNLQALNFVLAGILANPLRTDAQGKALGQILLEMPLCTSGEDTTPCQSDRP